MAPKAIQKKSEALEWQPIARNEPSPGFFASMDRGKPFVVVDFGHGGRDDPGAVVRVKGKKYIEAKITRQITQKLIDMLDSDGKVVARTSHEIAGKGPNETWLAQDRLNKLSLVNKSYPISFLVSIHLNADPSRRAKGPRVLYNKDANSAKLMHSAIVEVMNENSFGYSVPVKTEKTQSRDDLALLNSKFSSILVEPGFLTNATDRKILLSEEGQRLIARGIANAVYQLLGLDGSQFAMGGKAENAKAGRNGKS